jgi:lysophospholipase L1-like esterase
MSVLNRSRTLAACLAAAALGIGALVSAPAAGAAGDTYLALGDSLAYGFHSAQFNKEFAAGAVNPANYDEGYVDDFAKTLKASDPSLQLINDGCPGETTEALLHGASGGSVVFDESFCSDFPEGTPFPQAFLHHPYTTSQLTNALAVIAANHVTTITLDIGSNDLLQFLETKCGFPKENKCTEAETTKNAEHVIANVATILADLHAAAPHAQIVYLASYNPFPGVPAGADLQLAAFNAGLQQVAESIPKVAFANALPVFNPSGTSGGTEIPGDLPTICAFTAMCPGGVFNPNSPEADIHPTKLGYEVLGGIVANAFFSHFTQEFVNWVVSGSLKLRKLNQSVALPAGSTFNGESALNLATGSGKITGTIAVPAFEAPLKLFGVPVQLGLTVSQAGASAGTISPDTALEGGLSVSLPTKLNIGVTSFTILGLKIPNQCQTTEPLSLNLSDNLTFAELGSTGFHFMGTTTIPSVKCEGALGPVQGLVLSNLLSGPNNTYSLNIAPPTA